MGIEMSIKENNKGQIRSISNRSFLREGTRNLEGRSSSTKPKSKLSSMINSLDKKKLLKLLSRILIVLVVIAGGYYALRILNFTNSIGLKIKPSDLISGIKKDPELKKDSTGKYTNALLVGIDSLGGRAATANTDTIMIVSYNHENGDVVMYSIPRDFWVEVPNEGWYSKINALYIHGEKLEKGSGLKYLSKAVSIYTGLDIQYYAMVDLNGLKKIVDTVGGITINVENSFTDYCYPSDSESKNKTYRQCGDAGYYLAETLTFTKGPQVMDGATALRYARSRKGTAPEGGDFARAKRQQKVVDAIKEKVLSSDTLLNPQKALGIMDALEKNLTISSFTPEEVQAGINIALKQKDNRGKVYNFVLDYTIGNSKVMMNGAPNAGNLSVISTRAGVGNYTDVKAFIKESTKNPKLYTEDPVIRIYDTGITYAKAQQKTLDLQKKYPYLNILFMGTLFSDKEGIVVYSNTQELFPASIAHFANELKTDSVLKPEYIKSNLNGENLTIFLGKEVVVQESSN